MDNNYFIADLIKENFIKAKVSFTKKLQKNNLG
jgi:hypothetical protein